jgi:formate hydrogenlyase subunit 3/multisubunit Na+/H+ antiporter MnhD subunit
MVHDPAQQQFGECMNAPMIWVFIPLLSGILLWFLRDFQFAAKLIAIFISASLFVLSLLLPIDTVIQAGPFTFQIASEMTVLGRSLIIEQVDLPLLTLLYGLSIFWLFGAFFLRISAHFPSISLFILGLMIAAVSVEPFLYSAIIIEMIVLVTIPLFLRSGVLIGKGLMRFLQFQTLAMPFLLYAGWTILAVEANRANVQMMQQTIIALGLGFALYLAVFPFYSWIPLLTAEAEPYVAGYFLLFYPITTIHLGMKFLNTYSWLRESTMLLDVMRGAGLVLILSSGILAINQQETRKLFGYLVLLENGFALLALSLASQWGYQVYFASIIPRAILYALWSYATTKLYSPLLAYTRYADRKGVYFVVLFLTMLISIGLPLFVSAPFRVQIISSIQARPMQIHLLLLGLVGYGIGVFRSLYNFATDEIEAFQAIKIRHILNIESLMLFGGVFGTFAMGVFPHIFEPASLLLIQIYDKLIA